LKALGKKLALAGAGFLFAVAFAEVAVRMLGLAPEVAPVTRGRFRLSDNPVLIYEPIPHAAPAAGAETADAFFEYADRSNSLGFRDREHPLEAPPGATRIAVLGDSITAGWGIESWEDAFPARVEAGLEGRGLAVDLMSLGVSGYNTTQEVELLETKVLPYQPDLVVLAFCLNDIRPPDERLIAALEAEAVRSGNAAGNVSGTPGKVPGTSRGASSKPLRRLALKSALYRTVVFGPVPSEELAEQQAEEIESQARRPDLVTPQRDWVGPAFDELAALAEDRGFEVAVVVFPYLSPSRTYPEARQRVHDRVVALSARHGFPVLDLLEPLRRCRWDHGRIHFDRFHPNERGHACAADAITDWLAEDVLPEVPDAQSTGG
jgi:lysophospholipase L1-like esterase